MKNEVSLLSLNGLRPDVGREVDASRSSQSVKAGRVAQSQVLVSLQTLLEPDAQQPRWICVKVPDTWEARSMQCGTSLWPTFTMGL